VALPTIVTDHDFDFIPQGDQFFGDVNGREIARGTRLGHGIVVQTRGEPIARCNLQDCGPDSGVIFNIEGTAEGPHPGAGVISLTPRM
jgi:hypothetical protein